MAAKFKLSDFTSSFTPLPDGNYTIKIDEVIPEETQKGKPKLTFKGVVVEPHDKRNRKVIYSRVLQENAMWVLMNDLVAAEFSNDEQYPFDADGLARVVGGQMVGCMYKFAVKTRKYKGSDGEEKESNDFKLLQKINLVEGSSNGSVASAVENFSNV